MTQLRSLGVANVKEADEKDLCLSIGNLSLLRTLFVMSTGKLEKVPQLFNSLHSLTNLSLKWSRLGDDFLPHIQALPNLGELSLLNAYEGERLYFLEGFQKLRWLRIGKCPRLKEIAMNKGVMPSLEELYIIECSEFMRLPHDWECLPNLKEVYLLDVSSGSIEKIYGSQIMDQPPIRGIWLSRQEDGEACIQMRAKNLLMIFSSISELVRQILLFQL
ncbi:hypothetical protein CRYUN_Cryun09bG0219700 [Craigia yunnanensis]